jgi:hypothetical protein
MSEEEIEVEEEKKSNLLPDSFEGFLSKNYIQILFLVFIIFVFVNSDLFIDKFLSRIDNSVEHNSATSKGVFIQALFSVLLLVVLDVVLRFLF